MPLFYPFYQNWIEQGLSHFKPFLSEHIADCEAVCRDFQNILYGRLHTIAFRTLIEEMHLCKSQGSLSGNDSSAEYLYFCNVFLSNPDYQSSILEKYPVLKVCLDEACRQTTNNLCLLIQRFQQNLTRIENEILHGKVGKITGISANISDSHNGGNSVIKLEIDYTYYLIYKPHSLDNELAYEQLLQYLGKALHLDFYTPAILSFDTYGWEEYIVHKSCQNERETERFYYRMGICLFLAYLLKTNDLHQENLIAYGEYPVFIDLEALWSISVSTQETNIDHSIRKRLQDSVLATGILPSYHWLVNDKGVNVSAISHGKSQILPVKIPKIEKAYTSDMYIAYQFGTIPAANNYVLLKGKKISPEEYTGEIVRGFQESYLFFLEHTDQFLKQLQNFHKLFSRYLITDTQKYTMLLNASYHPQLMGSDKLRKQFLQNLHRSAPDAKSHSEKAPAIQLSEIHDLEHGDIPSFQIKYDSKDLFTHNKLLLKDFLAETPQEFLKQRIHTLNRKDMRYQIMLIEVSMGVPDDLIRGNSLHSVQNIKTVTPIDKTAAIHQGLKRLMDYAVFNETTGEISWATPQIVGKADSRFQMRAMDLYLYDGLAGLLLLFYFAVYKAQMSDYSAIFEMLKKQLFSYTTKLHGSAVPPAGTTGIFSGESSVAAVYLILYHHSRQPDYLEMACKHAEIIYRLLPQDSNNDLLGGKAGAILIFLELYHICSIPKYLEWAYEAEKRLTASAQRTPDGIAWSDAENNTPLLGMAHGNAGISLAYGKLYEITGDTHYARLLEQILQYEHTQYNSKTSDWYDYRSKYADELDKKMPAAWCHGAGGILSARLELADLNLPKSTRQMIEEDINKAVSRIKESYQRNTLCLCHGMCGNLLILEKYLKQYEDSEIEKICNDGYAYICSFLAVQHPKIIQEKYGAGLMTGYSGILLYLLISEAFNK